MTPRSFASFRQPWRLGWGAVLLVVGGLATGATLTPADEPVEWAVQAPLASESLLVDVARRGDLIVAVGERGHIVVSRDGGRSWSQAAVQTRALLTGVVMHDEQLGWAVGHDEVVVRTRDGGRNWERVHHAPEKEQPLLDVWFADARRGLAVGAYGSLLVTTDGGDTWTSRPVNGQDDFHLNHIDAGADGTLYLAAEAGRLYRSTDQGETWEALPSPYEGSFFGLLPLSDGSLLAYGLRGSLFQSRDQGRTWTQLETDTEATLTSALELGEGRFVVGGMAGTLLWSEPGGALRKQALPDRKAVVALGRGDDGVLLLFGEGGVKRVDVR
ncbi:MAG: hypothetical protein KJ061_03295 [Vicinamibacteraceae bacterium]|nr:hypothetical protein [Vicinamibacteraceae bacterium]